jgi:hypothetical protein
VLQYVTQDRLDFCFEFDLSYATLDAVNSGNAVALADKVHQVFHLYPYLQFGTFLTNHDQNRTLNALGFDEGKAKTAAGIYLTLPGVPFVYYGEEIGMIGSGDHLNIRSPMQWTAGAHAGFTTGTPWQTINGNYALYNVAVEDLAPGSLLEWYRRLIHVRNESPALRGGTYDPLASSASPVLAFLRRHEMQTVLCMANTSHSAIGSVTLTGSAGTLEPGAHSLINLLDPGDSFNITVSPTYQISGLSLAGHEVAVYELTGPTGVDPGDEDPPATGLRLGQSYPNPFGPSTTIRYSLPARSHVRLGVYDVAGREVAVIQDGVQAAGSHEARWDGADRGGTSLSAGVYFVRLDAGGETRTSKTMLMK